MARDAPRARSHKNERPRIGPQRTTSAVLPPSFFKQKTAYEMATCWSSDVCSSDRSEEHTSELQSRGHLVCRLLLGSEEHTSERQSRGALRCRLLPKKEKKTPA